MYLMEFHCLTLGTGWSVSSDVRNRRIVSKFIPIVNMFASFEEHFVPVVHVAFFFDLRVTFTDGGYRKMNPHAPNKTAVETNV